MGKTLNSLRGLRVKRARVDVRSVTCATVTSHAAYEWKRLSLWK